MTTRLLRSLWLFLVFLAIFKDWNHPDYRFWMVSILALVPFLPVTFPSLLEVFQEQELRLVSVSLSCSKSFLKVQENLYLFAYVCFRSVVPPNGKLSLLIRTMSCLLVGIRGFMPISKSKWILWVSFSETGSGLRLYHLVVWSKFKLFQVDHLTHPVLYSFSDNLLHSVIMWLTLTFFLQSLHLLFFGVIDFWFNIVDF